MEIEEILKLKDHGNLLLEHNEELDLELTRVLRHPQPVTVKDTKFKSGEGGSRTLSMNVNILPVSDSQGNLRRVFMLLSNISVVREKMTIGEYCEVSMQKTSVGHDLILKQSKNEVVVMLYLDFDLEGTKLMNEPQLLHKLMTVVQKRHGVVHEMTKDSKVVVFFGIPFPTDDDVQDACSTALKVREVMSIFNAENAGNHSVYTGISECLVDLFHGNHAQHKYSVLPEKIKVGMHQIKVCKKMQIDTICSENIFHKAREGFVLRKVCTTFLRGVEDFIHFQTEVKEVNSGNQKALIEKTNRQSCKMYEILVEGNFNEDENLLGGSYPMYCNGMDAFEAQQWDSAHGFFKSVVDHSEDQVSRLYMKRCQEMMDTEMKFEPEWNGLWDENFANAITNVYQIHEFAELTPSTPEKKTPRSIAFET
jgi:hypothetical protein